MTRLRVAAVQMRCEDGRVEGNLGRATGFVTRAVDDGARLVLLPELMPTGFRMTGPARLLREGRCRLHADPHGGAVLHRGGARRAGRDGQQGRAVADTDAGHLPGRGHGLRRRLDHR
jgi:predicted amidohydrolase